MKQKTFEKWLVGAIVVACIAAIIFLATAKAQSPLLPDSVGLRTPVPENKRKILGEIKTVFDANGRPINQSQSAKGFHRVSGTIKLSRGRALITLNTRTIDGRQDVSFISSLTYKGVVTITDTVNNKTYRVYPQNGRQAIIMSSDTSDTATVGYTLEGE